MTSQIFACFILVLLDSIHRTFFFSTDVVKIKYFVYLFTTIKCYIKHSFNVFSMLKNKLHDFNHIWALKLTVWSWLCWFTPSLSRSLSLSFHMYNMSVVSKCDKNWHIWCVCVCVFSKDVPAVSMPGVTYTLSSAFLSVMMFASLAL